MLLDSLGVTVLAYTEDEDAHSRSFNSSPVSYHNTASLEENGLLVLLLLLLYELTRFYSVTSFIGQTLFN